MPLGFAVELPVIAAPTVAPIPPLLFERLPAGQIEAELWVFALIDHAPIPQPFRGMESG
jgi:hypothetical protein